MRAKVGGIVLVVVAAIGAVVLLSSSSSTNERPAINRAINAPFIDYERRDARELCEDFTPAVARQFGRNISHAPTCEARVVDALSLSKVGLEHSHSTVSLTPLAVADIKWHANHAAVYFGSHSNEIGLTLEKIGGKWRISTPAGLIPSCNYFDGRQSCVYGLWVGSA